MTGTVQASPDPSWRQQASWRHIWAISWPVLLANITFPLVGAADTAMMGRLDDASFVGGVALGSLVFNFIYFGLGFLRMGTTGLVAQARGADIPLAGLMCIPPLGIEPAPFFALLDKLARDNGLAGRSMGMSGDYETAVMTGATHVRVGTALFGQRAR